MIEAEWEYDQGEPWRAYEAAKLYIEAGEGRSIAVTAARLGSWPGYPRLCHKWAAKWRWAERAIRYDRLVQEQGEILAREAELDRIEELEDVVEHHRQQLYKPFESAWTLVMSLIALGRNFSDPDLAEAVELMLATEPMATKAIRWDQDRYAPKLQEMLAKQSARGILTSTTDVNLDVPSGLN